MSVVSININDYVIDPNVLNHVICSHTFKKFTLLKNKKYGSNDDGYVNVNVLNKSYSFAYTFSL